MWYFSEEKNGLSHLLMLHIIFYPLGCNLGREIIVCVICSNYSSPFFAFNKVCSCAKNHSDLQIRVHNQKIYFLISQPKHMLWAQEPSH